MRMTIDKLSVQRGDVLFVSVPGHFTQELIESTRRTFASLASDTGCQIILLPFEIEVRSLTPHQALELRDAIDERIGRKFDFEREQ